MTGEEGKSSAGSCEWQIPQAKPWLARSSAQWRQKACPHWVSTGDSSSSRQIEQERTSSWTNSRIFAAWGTAVASTQVLWISFLLAMRARVGDLRDSGWCFGLRPGPGFRVVFPILIVMIILKKAIVFGVSLRSCSFWFRQIPTKAQSQGQGSANR